jgi:hypothetical protein
MEDRMQRWLTTALAAIITGLLNRMVTNRFIKEDAPAKRGIKEDALEAVLEGGVAIASTILAAVIVRRIFSDRKG